MALPQGINFRGSSGYVTDPTDYDYSTATTADYPRTSAQGNSIGWESGTIAFSADRDSTVTNKRLAGTAASFGGAATFRVTLPASGDHNVGVAVGDMGGGGGANQVTELYDTTTLLQTLVNDVAIAQGSFCDAANTEYTAANFIDTSTLYAATFSTTIARWTLAVGGVVDKIASLYVEAAAAGGIIGPLLGGHLINGGVLRGRLVR